MNKSLNELAIKSSMAFGGTLISKIIGFVFGILVGRLLGASIYGQFSYMISFLSIFVILSSLGLTNGLVGMIQKFEVSGQFDKKRSLVSFSIFITVILSLIISLIFYLNLDTITSQWLNRPSDKWLFALMLPTLPLIAVRKIAISVLRAEKKIGTIVLITNIFSPMMRMILLLFMVSIFKMHSIYVLIIGYYIYNILSFIWVSRIIWQDKLIGRFKWSSDHLDIIRFSIPMLLSGIVGIIITNVDQYMIGFLISNQQVGIYRVALQFGTFASFGLYAVNSVFAPMISYLFHDGQIDTLRANYSISTKWIYIIGLLIFGVMLLFGRDVLLIVGSEFVSGYWALVFIALGQIVSTMVGSAGYMLAMTGHPEYELYGNLMVMIINIVLNYFLIQQWGIVGAAIASMISVALANLYKLYALYHTLKIHPFNKSYIGVLFSSILAIILMMLTKPFLPSHYLLRLVTGTAMYSLLYLFLIYRLTLKKEEKDWLLNGLKKAKKKVAR